MCRVTDDRGTQHRNLVSLYCAPNFTVMKGKSCTVKEGELEHAIVHYTELVRHALLNHTNSFVVDAVHYAAKEPLVRLNARLQRQEGRVRSSQRPAAACCLHSPTPKVE